MSEREGLLPGYRVREVSREGFDALRERWMEVLYPQALAARATAYLEGAPRPGWGASQRRRQLVVETDDAEGAFVAWAVGRQSGPHAWRMNNTAVMPEHRRRGIYSALCERVCAWARE